MPIDCKLLYRSTRAHLQQLFTGFNMLHRAGVVRLSQQRTEVDVDYRNPAVHLRDAGHAHLDVIVDRRVRVHFDTHDSVEIALGDLDRCDVYFKRSFSRAFVDALPARARAKLRPLGLNYRVLSDAPDTFGVRRSLATPGARFAGLGQALDTGNRLRFHPRVTLLESAPAVLFLVAAYDPFDDVERSPDKVADRIAINTLRAQCIRRLKDELGPRFTGGFVPGEYSRRNYGELVAPAQATGQQNYLAAVRSHPICVASTGLHGSVGWKLAEYVAMSRAIISEPLLSELPGRFEPGRNYLRFTSADECVSAALKLLEDRPAREAMMVNNANYYRTHLRPDALVRNALKVVMELTATVPRRSAGLGERAREEGFRAEHPRLKSLAD